MEGIGWSGIAASVIGRNHPIGAVFGALIFSILLVGGSNAQVFANIPSEITVFIQGITIVVLAVPELYRKFKQYRRGVWDVFR